MHPRVCPRCIFFLFFSFFGSLKSKEHFKYCPSQGNSFAQSSLALEFWEVNIWFWFGLFVRWDHSFDLLKALTLCLYFSVVRMMYDRPDYFSRMAGELFSDKFNIYVSQNVCEVANLFCLKGNKEFHWEDYKVELRRDVKVLLCREAVKVVVHKRMWLPA